MQFDRAKLKAVILYTCARSDQGQLGAVKLHKVLYYADMLRYAETGTPLTGATYRKLPFGPTCDQLLSSLAELAAEGAIETRETPYFGYIKKEYLVRRSAEINRMNEDELKLLDEVIDFVCINNSARTISEYSHNRAWELAEPGQIIPYSSVIHLFPTQASKEALEWGAAQAGKIEDQRSQKDPVDYVDFAAFRSQILQARGSK
jgi:hypothetical protein